MSSAAFRYILGEFCFVKVAELGQSVSLVERFCLTSLATGISEVELQLSYRTKWRKEMKKRIRSRRGRLNESWRLP